MKKFLALAAAISIMPMQTASAASITFYNMGTFNSAALEIDDVTITGATTSSSPGTLYILNFNGVGVIGGLQDTQVESGESLLFDFDTAASDVIIGTQLSGSTGSTLVTAYDPNDNLIGSTSYAGYSTRNVSNLFGNVELGSVSIKPQAGARWRLNTLSYTTVPEPSSLALLGLGGLLLARRRRR